MVGVSRFAIAALMFIAAPSAAHAQYFAGIDDLPLAPGLQEQPAAEFAFASAQGRVIGASAQGVAAPATVLAFYVETLPALGWSLSPGGDDLVFLRGRERLVLSITATPGGARLDVRLLGLPAPGP